MPRDIISISPVGNIDRRNLVTLGKSEDVLSRENLAVIGINKDERRVRKMAGSDRYNTTSVGSLPVTSIFRYYSGASLRKNFFYAGGYLYFIDESGTATQILGFFSLNAYPTFLQFKVSGSNIAYFMEGVSTGMYSYDGNIGNSWTKETAVTLNFVDAVGFLDRMFAFEEDSEDLYFSKNLEPTNFTDSTDAGVITIGAKRGSKLQRIMVGDDSNLYIFKTDSVWVLLGKTPSEFTVQELNPSMGLAARRSLQKVNQGFVGLMSDYEIHSMTGTQFKLLTYNVALSGDLTKNLIPIINMDKMDSICSTYHNFLYRMSFTENGETVNDMEYCFNTINETEFFTRGNKVGAYLVYDRVPDKKELVTGRSDEGRLMKQYHGLNWDNQATSPTMSIKTKTKFMGLGKPRNFRVRKAWLNSGVLGARPVPIRTYVDARNATSDSTQEDMQVYGESKGNITLLKIASQDAITSRQIPYHNNGKGQNVAFEISESIPDFDFEIVSFDAEIIGRSLKRNAKVGI